MTMKTPSGLPQLVQFESLVAGARSDSTLITPFKRVAYHFLDLDGSICGVDGWLLRHYRLGNSEERADIAFCLEMEGFVLIQEDLPVRTLQMEIPVKPPHIHIEGYVQTEIMLSDAEDYLEVEGYLNEPGKMN